ncbi:TRAP transporter substrate-binding protein DctP [Bacilliculturomica massiliensis]|uniref:TRAP transporter substrate-binding protein DctP n=1 Tax=Bacilliculturomica massiliensis TaxID=1917867 RepID=UPI0010319045|nr:TRAP transporter substrate-binding protein DctP [Bacilliculturomica massiliensis]
MNKKLKKSICIICMLTLISACFAGCGGGGSGGETGDPDKVYKLSWAGIGSTEAIDTWIAEEAAKNISEATDGHVEITVYPASQLGDYVQAYEEIMQGTIDMGLFTMTGSHDIFAESLYIPFFVQDTEEFKEAYGQDSYIYKTYSEFQQKYGVKTFGFWPSGFLGLGFADLTDKARGSLFDFSVHKEDLVRAPAMETMALIIKAMNFNTTTINYADLYTALQTGVADGWYGGGPYLNYVSFVDVIDHFVDYKIMPDVYACIMNQAKWDTIPEEYQTIINDCIVDALNQGADQLAVQEEESIQGLRDAGVEVIIPSDEERASMSEFMKTNVWPRLADYYGEDYMNELAEYSDTL